MRATIELHLAKIMNIGRIKIIMSRFGQLTRIMTFVLNGNRRRASYFFYMFPPAPSAAD